MAVPISGRSDAELVRDVGRGQLDAFNVLVRRWERKVYSYLVHLTGHREDAFDLCQDVFVSAYQNLDRLRQPERFAGWLFQIAHNRAYSHLRGARGQYLEPAETDPAAAPREVRLGDGRVWERGEMRLLVERSLATLPVEQREAIVLKLYQGLNFAEIAAIQGCPVSTAKTRLYTGFEQLRKTLLP